MTQTLSYPATTLTNPDNSTTVIGVDVTYQFMPAPPVPPPPPAPLFWAGTSYRSATEAVNWFGTRFGLLFFNPATGNPFSATQLSAVIAKYPNVLWCVCDKGDPAISVPPICSIASSVPQGLWYVYDQEPEGDDPAAYKSNVLKARQLIDHVNARSRVKLVAKFARYPNIVSPGLWKQYFCGTVSNPVEDVLAADDYARPGIQFPTTRYGTSEELFGWGLDAADQMNVPHAVTEYARLPLATDTQGTLLVDQTDDDVAYLRDNRVLGISFWTGKGNVLGPDGKPVDFTPLPAVRSDIKSIIRGQG